MSDPSRTSGLGMPGRAEVLLPGGRVTQGVVRVGDTVRRPPTANSAFVRALLGHLCRSGFDGVPRSLGVDAVGREMFSFIAGEVPTDLGWHDDDVLCAAAALIRQYHDLTQTMEAVLDEGAEVACHNDLSPCNFVFRRGRPVAMIDFDAATPGARLHDLGYAAWMWLDLGNEDIDVNCQKRRLKVFASAYCGGLSLEDLVQFIVARQALLMDDANDKDDRALGQWAKHCLIWTRRAL